MTRGRPPYPDVLTPREWEVLALIREGLTNEQIASRLGITERGARFHVSEILSKLYVSSRAEAAAWRPEARRRFALFPIVLRGLGTLGLGVAALALIALAVGVAITGIPGGEKSELETAPNINNEGSLDELISVAGEAQLEAQQALPGAQLVMVGYSTANGTYTFRFAASASTRELSLLGPSAQPFPRWELLSEERPPDVQPLEPIDVNGLRHSPKEIASAAAEESSRSAQNIGVSVWSEDRQVKWQALAPIGDQSIVTCLIADAEPLDQMVCER
nr:hypothetical protein [uncultured bacterium]